MGRPATAWLIWMLRVSIAAMIEMPTLEPRLRTRLKRLVASVAEPRVKRGEGEGRQRDEDEAEAQALDDAGDDDRPVVHLGEKPVICQSD